MRENSEIMTLEERRERIRHAEEDIRAYGDRELLALFLLLKETNIRLLDLLELTLENIFGRELKVIESKYSKQNLYKLKDGNYPTISDETWELLVPGEDGRYFQRSKEYYVRLFRKVITDKTFRYYEMRAYFRYC